MGPGEEEGQPAKLNPIAESSGEEQHQVEGIQSASGRQTWAHHGVSPPRFESVRDSAVGTCGACAQLRSKDGESKADGRRAGRVV